jgi:flagellar protein FlaF
MNTDNNQNPNPAAGYSAYAQTQNVAENSRDVEYRLLAQVTGSLVKAKDQPDNVKKRVESAIWNRDVWSALRVDLCSDQNKLPQDLKASLVSLSLWIERETNAVIDGKGDIEALIEVNRNIMSGLRPEMREESNQNE